MGRWPEAAIDLVLDVFVLHYLSPAHLHDLIGAVRAALKPGGIWLIIEANATAHGRRAFEYTHMYTIDEVATLLPGNWAWKVHRYEGLSSPVFPLLCDAVLNQLALWPFYRIRPFGDRWIQPEKRSTWVLALQKPQ